MQVNYNKVLPLSNENTYYQKDRTRADKDGEERGLLFTVGETKIRFFFNGKHTSSPKTRMSIHLTIEHIFSGSEIKMSETYQHFIFMAALFAINEI